MLKAVIFDMDGIVFNTEPVYDKSTKLFLLRYDVKLKREDLDPFRGRGSIKHLMYLKEKYNLKDSLDYLIKERRKVYEELTKKGIKTFSGIKKILEELKKNKIKIGLATSSTYTSTKENFKHSKLNKKLFNIIVTRDEIKNTKPNPEIFLRTIKKLQVKIQECVIIEDAVSGVEAGKRAGAKVIAITNSFSESKLKRADLVVNSAKELNLDKIKSLVSGKIFFIIGPTGSGKTIISNYVLKHRPKTIRAISYTTRNKRNGEANGKDYFFVSRKKFKDMIKKEKFIEYSKVYGEFYGTIKGSFNLIEKGHDIIKIIDYKGAEKLKKKGLNVICIFLAPKNIEILKERLKRRGDKDIKERLKIYKKELKFKKECNYFIDTSGSKAKDIENKAKQIINIMNKY